MKFYEYINEKLLHSEFKIGFEFECIMKYKNEQEKFGKAQEELEDLDGLFFKGQGDFGYDSSIKVNNRDVGIEYKSPPLNFTPENFSKILNFLTAAITSEEIYTNETCGFHVHMSFPRISDLDAAWIVTCMAASNNFLKTFKKLGNFKFFNDEYASMKNIVELKSDLMTYQNKNQPQSHDSLWKDLRLYFSLNGKYNLFRIHPQGTLEWRGPRDFMNQSEVRYIKDFLKLLWEYISWISNAMNLKTIPETNITKKEFYENMKDLILFNATKDKITNKEEGKIIKFKNEILEKAIELPWVYNMFKNEYDHNLWKKVYNAKNDELGLNLNVLDFNIENGRDCIWNSGLWLDGNWYSGNFYGGRFYGGNWYDGTFVDGVFSDSMFFGGRWFDGKFQDNSMWVEGEIYSTRFNKYIKSTIDPGRFYEIEKKI